MATILRRAAAGQRQGAPGARPRYHGLDGLRAFAMLLGIVLHATLPYFSRMVGIEYMWPADDDQSLAMFLLFDFIHLWRMPVFFLLAGFFAHLMLERRSTAAFVSDRLLRIAAPLVPFTGVMALILPALWHYGWKGAFVVDPGVLDPRKWPHFASQGTPLAHLWFLWHLLIMYGALLACRCAGASRFARTARAVPAVASLERRTRAAVYARAPLLLMAAAAILLAWRGGDESKPIFPPNVPDLLYGALFFAYGYGLWTRRALLEELKRDRTLAVLWASGVSVYALHLILLALLKEIDIAGAGGTAAWLARAEVLASGAAVVLLVLALAGSFEALLTTPRQWVRWTADASYWIYLIHLPLVAWLTFWLAHLDRGRRAHHLHRVRLERRTESPGRHPRHHRDRPADLPLPGAPHPPRHPAQRPTHPPLTHWGRIAAGRPTWNVHAWSAIWSEPARLCRAQVHGVAASGDSSLPVAGGMPGW